MPYTLICDVCETKTEPLTPEEASSPFTKRELRYVSFIDRNCQAKTVTNNFAKPIG
jgi:hypothetical protein